MRPSKFNNLQAVADFLHLEKLSSKDEEIFESFIKTYIDTIPFTTTEILQASSSLLGLSPALEAFILQEFHVLKENKDLLFVACFLKHLLFEAKEASENTLYETFSLDGFSSGSLRVLLLLSQVSLIHAKWVKKQIPLTSYEHNFSALKNNIQKHFEQGELDVDNFRWCVFQASLVLFKLGYLTFNPYVFQNYFKVYQHKVSKELLLCAGENIEVRYDGQINGVNNMFDQNAVITQFYTKGDIVFAHIIEPTGHIDLNIQSFSLQDYEEIIQHGDHLLEIHIPPKKGYTPDNVYASFKEAIAFFKTYFSEYHFKAFWSLSWLYSPQLQEFLTEEESNIRKIQELFYLVPLKVGEETAYFFLFGKKSITPEEIDPKTTLLKRLKIYLEDGKKITCGGMIFLLEDISNFYTKQYKRKK